MIYLRMSDVTDPPAYLGEESGRGQSRDVSRARTLYAGMAEGLRLVPNQVGDWKSPLCKFDTYTLV